MAHGAELTEAGKAFLAGVKEMPLITQRATMAARRAARGELGSLRVGFTSTATFNVVVPSVIRSFRRAYPEIEFITPEEVDPSRYYATYNIGLFFDDEAHTHQPVDFRHVGLHRTAGHILGVDPEEMRKVAGPDTAVCMMTNPNTLGLFEPRIHEVADVVHAGCAVTMANPPTKTIAADQANLFIVLLPIS